MKRVSMKEIMSLASKAQIVDCYGRNIHVISAAPGNPQAGLLVATYLADTDDWDTVVLSRKETQTAAIENGWKPR